MREFLLAGVLLVAILMILTAVLVAARAWLLPQAAAASASGEGAARTSMEGELPPALVCKVLSSRTVSPLMREVILALPEGERMEFSAGGWVEITAPPFTLSYSEYALSPEHRSAWDRIGLWGLSAASGRRETRPYWIANMVEDGKEWLVLWVKLALPPPDRPDAAPGKVSSWAFGLRPGDAVEIRGSFGGADVTDSQEEMVLIGTGYGLAPIRAILSAELSGKGTRRKISLWVGARSEADLVHYDELDRLAAAYSNFTWSAALSEPEAAVQPPVSRGFVHEILRRDFLGHHAAPEECEYHVYGPPLMTGSVLAALDDFGVEGEQVRVNGVAAGQGCMLVLGDRT